jgi:hypothetical protein
MTVEPMIKPTDESHSQHTGKRIGQAVIKSCSDSDKALQLTQYWTPQTPFWKPLKKKSNASVGMACVVENKLYQGLRFEGDVMLLTPGNWQHVLKYGKPDFLLMESIWNTATGHWYMGQTHNKQARQELLKIIALARKYSIPTVFWLTRSHNYHDHYKDFALHFDHVFCADCQEVELMKTEGIEAELLLPCIQPAIHNPFRHFENCDDHDLGILYDGWADLDRMTDDLNVLKAIKPYGLKIIESRYKILRRRKELLPDYLDCLLGCVTEQGRILALKYAKAYVTLKQTLSTSTTQQWMTLEAVASRLPAVHLGELRDDDVRKDLVIECRQEIEFMAEFVRFQKDDIYRERVAHLGWRKVFQTHTFAHRVQKICRKIGVDHDWEEYPKASLITPTIRRKRLPDCITTFEKQTYPNKELVLVYNGSEPPSYEETGIDPAKRDVKITHVPGDMFAGACLNQGHMLAEGEYFFRVDDDDYYGPNYVLDMVLLARSIDADLFGKPPVAILFQGDPLVYVRGGSPPLIIVNGELFAKGKVWMGGNSFSGSRTFFEKKKYSELSYGAADSSLIFNLMTEDDNQYTLAFMDHLNLVIERRKDQNSHTWKIDNKQIKKKLVKTATLKDFFV